MYKHIRDVQTPVVGETYLVPCVEQLDDWVPILGDIHTDIELGVIKEHYHYDIRFLDDEQAWALGEYRNRLPLIQGKIHYIDTWDVFLDLPLVMLRDFLEFPHSKDIRWKRFHRKYKGQKVKRNKCPHRGFDLSCVKARNGVIQCPLHGLRIDEKTQKVLPKKYNKKYSIESYRAQKQEQPSES